MSQRILVINPNSTQAVTANMSRALEPLSMEGGPAIECMTLAEGPPGVESQADVESVVLPVSRVVRDREGDFDAFVIACYSDPGLHAAREATARPVFGIAECGMLTALTLGERFGVISILAKSIPRHLRYVRALGLDSRFAGDQAIGLGHGLRRHGAVQGPRAGGDRDSRRRTDPSHGDHGDRRGAPDRAGLTVFNPGRRCGYVDIIRGFDVLLAGVDPVTPRVMDAEPNLRLISRIGIGRYNRHVVSH